MATKAKRIHLIGCGVLKVDLTDVIERLHIEVSTEYLPAGLHSRPHELHSRLQEAIDRASKEAAADLIAIGYGVCGLGTVDIHSREVPLSIPRVHDCIALFLGSDGAYNKQFGTYPGTYYLSAGWVEGKSQPQLTDKYRRTGSGPTDEEFNRFVEEYGEENAEAIRHFLTSWQRNYQRAAFIDTGSAAKRKTYDRMAQDMAKEYGWIYEKIEGNRTLLEKLLTTEETTDEILIVPPQHLTVFDPTGRKLKAIPIRDRLTDQASHFTMTIPPETEVPEEQSSQPHLGLGIDAGGTYTDTVLFDFSRDEVIQKAKAPTTKWDYLIGIENALDQIAPDKLKAANLVSVSTTLATNALVEGRGQRVGLLVMPPYGWKGLENFKHEPIAIIEGQLEIDGSELAPINPEEVRGVVSRMIEKSDVKAFAVAGYAGHVNPSHELEVKRIIQEETHLPVTCGHDVSEGLNYRVRAETAALNARIIPYLESLFEKIGLSLKKRKISAPIMVVKSDGSLTSIQTAIDRPIETILSGPAASVAGVKHLTKQTDAIVVDIGGTTSDTAIIKEGIVRTCDEGAIVGGWQTHVNALDMRTMGLGGDSLISWEKGETTIGPRRVAPVSWLTSEQPRGLDAIAWIERHLNANEVSSRGLEIVTLNGYDDSWRLDERETRIVETLREAPCSLEELAKRVDCLAWQLLPVGRLEEAHVIQRCGLTPTDLLHVAGKIDLWDKEAARRMCAVFAKLQRMDPQRFVEEILARVERQLAEEILKKHLDTSIAVRAIESSAVARALVDNAMRGGDDGLRVSITLKDPVVGIGAPAHLFLPEAATLLHSRAVIPPHADVANAIGAITSSVYVHRQVTITIDERGVYHLKGLPDAPTFESLEKAQEFAVVQLKRMVREMALKSGTNQTQIEIVGDDSIGTAADGTGVFLGRTLEARLTGRPDIARLRAKA